jgi:glycosyltransferase involved in cell wall biosynthesis
LKKSILFILHLPPPIHGAAMVGQYIKDGPIVKETFDTDFINLAISDKLGQIGKYQIGKFYRLLRLMTEFWAMLLKKKHDLYYITLTAKGSGFYKDFTIVLILKLFRKKIIYHFHNKGVSTLQDNVYNNILYRFLFKNTQSILLSEKLYYDIEEYVLMEDVFFCANGLPKADLIINQNRQKIENEAPPRILFLSNMMIEKGILVLLEACKVLKEKGIKFKCDFVGPWTDITEKDFNTIVSDYNLTGYVYAYGQQYNGAKENFLNNTDIFVLPTYYNNECFPLVILEAMEHALPVVSTFEGAIAEMIVNGKTGFVGPQHDSQFLIDKLEYLIKNPEARLEMGAAAKERFDNFYTIDTFEKNIVSILKKSIDRA